MIKRTISCSDCARSHSLISKRVLCRDTIDCVLTFVRREVSAANFAQILLAAEIEKKRNQTALTDQKHAVVPGAQKPIQRTVSKLLQPSAAKLVPSGAAVPSGGATAATMADTDESGEGTKLSTGSVPAPSPSPASDDVIKYLTSIMAGGSGGGWRRNTSGNQYIGTVGSIGIPQNSTGLITSVLAVAQAGAGANPPVSLRLGLAIKVKGMRIYGYLDWEYVATASGADREAQRAIRCIIAIDRTPTLGGSFYSDPTMPPTDQNAITASWGVGTEYQVGNRFNPSTKERYHILKDHKWDPQNWAGFSDWGGVRQAHRTEKFDWWIPMDFTQIYQGPLTTDYIVNSLDVFWAADTMGPDVNAAVKYTVIIYFEDADTTNGP